jgi:hypothetical protein
MMIWLTLLLWLLCDSAKADSYAYLQMNLKSNDSLNIVKADIIKMAEDKADTPRGYIKQKLGLDSSGIKNINNFLEGLAKIESDKNNYAHGSNKKSSAGGFFQFLNANGLDGGFDGSSLDTALTRIKRVFGMLGKKLPKQFADAYANKSVTGLGFDDQATLALINLQQNPGKTNELLTAIGRGDTGAARNLYENFHLTTAYTGKEQAKKIGKKVDRTFKSLLKPVEDAALGEMPSKSSDEVVADALRVVESPPDTPELVGEQGVGPDQIGGVGEDSDLIFPGAILTLPPEQSAPVSERIHNIMKPRN